jgi:hypothetical protein
MPHPATEPHFLLPFHQILLCPYLVIEVIFPDDIAVLACVDRAEFYLFLGVVGGKLRQDKTPHKVHQSAKRDLTAKQQE